MSDPLLRLILLPLATAAVIFLLGNRRAWLARWMALVATLLVLAWAAELAWNFTPRSQTAQSTAIMAPQQVLRVPWMTFALPTLVTGGDTSGQTHHATIEFYLGMDGISLWLVVLTAVLMVSAVLISWSSITERVAEYYALLLALQSAMIGVFCAFDLILFYIFFEFTLLPLFFLIGIWGGEERQYAAVKFFLYTLAGSLVSLVGIVALVLALYSRSPDHLTFSIPELAEAMRAQMAVAEGMPVAEGLAHPGRVPPGGEVAWLPEQTRHFWQRVQWWVFLALFVGFAVKVPLFPFHTWLPLAHTQAPTAGSVLLAGVLLKLGGYGFLRICLPLLPYGVWNLGVPLVAPLAVIGILYGALCALVQTDIKKLVAYSSISHLGFCMLGLFALNVQGVTGGLLQMVNHGLSTGGLFLVVGMLYERYHTRERARLGGLASKLPVLTFFAIFICMSSVGLPGLNGFIGEMMSLLGMFAAHTAYAVVGAIGIILGAWYLLLLIQGVFFGPLREPAEVHQPVRDLGIREWFTIAPIAVLCLAIGLYPAPLVSTITPEIEPITALYENGSRLEPTVDRAPEAEFAVSGLEPETNVTVAERNLPTPRNPFAAEAR